ncbi:MAG: hypothetical protein K8L97_32920 [Anaerolineae bacterium]|nr:hypothetical protein [Anaerolineae bacterium]
MHTKHFSSSLVASMMIVLFVVTHVTAQDQPFDSDFSDSFMVESIDWSPDGTKIAVGGGPISAQCDLSDTTGYAVRILDGETFAVLNELAGHSCNVVSVAWSPDSTQLITGSGDGTIRLWDAESGDILLETPVTTFGGKISLSWHPDGTQFTAIDSATHTLELYDAIEGQRVEFLPASLDPYIASAVWSPNESKLVASMGGGDLIVWDGVEGAEITRIENPHSSTLSGAIWSPDGQLIATSGRDLTINIWDVTSGQKLQSINYEYDMYGFAWGNKHILATTHTDKIVRFWDTETGQMLFSVGYEGIIYAIDWHPERPCLALGSTWGDGVFIHCFSGNDGEAVF